MLGANKKALKTGVMVKLLHIRDKELDYFYNSCNQISTQSALLAGFCYSGMTYLKYVDRDICERTCAEFTYPLTVMCAMGFAMLSLWQATLASMLAPGLALRGPAGSMEVAVNQLMEEYRGATRLFAISLFLFMLTAVLWSWTSNETVTSVLGTIAMLVIMRLIYGAAMRAFADFDFNPELTDEFDHKEVISGGWSAADPTPQLSADPLYTARRSRPELSRTDSAASVGSTFSDTDRLGSPSPAPWRRASFDQSSSWRRTSFDVSSPQPLAVKPGGTLFGKGALPTLSGRRGTGPAVTPPRGRGRRRWSQFGTAGWSLL